MATHGKGDSHYKTLLQWKNPENKERRKRMSISISWETRGEREFVLNILKIERRTRHENSLLKLKRENYENFLRPRLPSRSEILLVHPVGYKVLYNRR